MTQVLSRRITDLSGSSSLVYRRFNSARQIADLIVSLERSIEWNRLVGRMVGTVRFEQLCRLGVKERRCNVWITRSLE